MSQEKICPSCKAIITKNESFCSSCGNPIKDLEFIEKQVIQELDKHTSIKIKQKVKTKTSRKIKTPKLGNMLLIGIMVLFGWAFIIFFLYCWVCSRDCSF